MYLSISEVRTLLFQLWSWKSKILPEYVDSSVRIYNGKNSCIVRSQKGKLDTNLDRVHLQEK